MSRTCRCIHLDGTIHPLPRAAGSRCLAQWLWQSLAGPVNIWELGFTVELHVVVFLDKHGAYYKYD